MSNTSNPEYTLFLWVKGAYPRRIVYQLLCSGLVASVADLNAGKVDHPNFHLNVITLTLEDGSPVMRAADPNDPTPVGKSSPALRIRNTDTGSEEWIHESGSIAMFLAEQFPAKNPVVSSDPVKRAQALDSVQLNNLACQNLGTYISHALPAQITTYWSKLSEEDRSKGAGLNAKLHIANQQAKLQDWAAASLEKGGWLTPGIEGPGVVDCTVAGVLRYFWLGYEVDMLEDERLGPLRDWWKRFKSLPWWEELEETGEVHPSFLRFPKDLREW